MIKLKTNSIKSLIYLYKQQYLEEKALEYSLKQLLWYENHFSERYLSIANILLEISQLYDDENSNKIVYLEKALNIFQNNIHIQYLTTSNCLICIGNHYFYDKARNYYLKAIEIQNKIYPKDHSIILKTQSIIDTIPI